MNILPKKRWHVRTKENIARVRRDEAQAAEELKLEQARIAKAESEARLNLLRKESRQKNGTALSDVPESIQSSSKVSSKHINFFEELEQGNLDHHRSNKDYEKDKKEEQEKYEKQIGYLTYLGQGIKEAVSSSWYNEIPKRLCDTEKKIEIKPNKKALDDPMVDIKRYLKIMSSKKEHNKEKCKDNKIKPCKLKEEAIMHSKKRKRETSSDDSHEDCHQSRKKHKKKHKKHKKSKKHKKQKEKEREIMKPSYDIEKLRAERLEREKVERLRAQQLIAEHQTHKLEKNAQSSFRQKYNSQFFPELARQNCEKNYR